MNFLSFDLDNDGLIDEVSWVVPHLSNQTFRIIIITRAEHLDNSRQLIEEIYSYVFEKDEIWRRIPDSEFVRVTFETNLTNENDIT